MKRPLAVFSFIAAFILALYARSLKNDIKDISFDKQSITLCGTLSDIVHKKTDLGDSYTLYLDNVYTDDPSLLGEFSGEEKKIKIIAFLSDNTDPPYRIGSTLKVTGKAFMFERASNPGQFDTGLYYAARNIRFGIKKAKVLSAGTKYSKIRDLLYRIRKNISERIGDNLPEEEASLLKTMLLNEKGELDEDLRELYGRSGIAHILSISSLHISIIGLALFKLLKKTGLKHGGCAVLSSAVMILYGAMTGFSVSAVRAIASFVMSMTAIKLKRSYDAVTSLFLTALILLIINPLYIYDQGFVYSFGCALGIVLFMPSLLPYEDPTLSKRASKVLYPFVFYLVLIPLYLNYSYKLPLYSVFLNILILPLMGILIPLGFLFVIMLCIYAPAAIPLKLMIIGILNCFKDITTFADSLPYKYLNLGAPKIAQSAVYCLIMILIILLKKKISLKARYLMMIPALLIITVRIRGGLETTYTDVGQGDGIYIRISDEGPVKIPGVSKEFVMLIDSGSSSVKDVGKRRLIPYLDYTGTGNIDVIALSHPDDDHLNGLLYLMENAASEDIKIKTLIMSNIDPSSMNESFLNVVDTAKKHGIQVILMDDKMSLSPGFGDVSVKCLFPYEGFICDDANASSLCLLLDYKGYGLLFTGDIEGRGEDALRDKLKDMKDKDPQVLSSILVLKVAHHGSKNSTGKEILSLINPENAVISCELNGSYGHPHKELLSRLTESGAKIYRTDTGGAISLRIRNGRYWFETFY